MGLRGVVYIALLTLMGCVALYVLLAPKNPFNPAEAALFNGLDQLVSESDPTPADFVDAFGLPTECGSGDCYIEKWPNPALGNPRVRLSQEVGGSIFTIELDRVCVRTDRVTVKYRGGKIESLCDHGPCPTYAVWSDWGIMAFDWPRKPSNCVGEIVINTGRLFRDNAP